MKRIFLLLPIIFITTLVLSVPGNALAAKKFVPKQTVRSAGLKAAVNSIPSVVKYRGDKLGILLSFSNFSGIDSVAYSFTYTTNGNSQGAGGTISPSNNPTAQRELLFGTCSTAVCTYHYNLANARLVLTAKFTNGRTVSKAYRIKTYN